MIIKKKSFDFMLKKAGIRRTKREYLVLSAGVALIGGFFMAVVFFLATLSRGINVFPAVLLFILVAFVVMTIALLAPRIAIANRKAEIESDIIYSVRHFLLKLDSGSSLLQALEDVSMLPTVSSKYFADVYYEIKMGKPLNDAVTKAIDYSPSTQFRSVMEKIKSSLLTGSDIKKSLKDLMKEMMETKVIEIKKYGKKLGPMTMLYMIFGTIAPSLGATMFVIATAFVGSGQYLANVVLVVMSFMLLIAQFSFFFLFRQMRPKVGF